MSIQSLLSAAALAGSVAAFPSLLNEKRQNITEFPYQAPKPGDSRAPCPALNTLANHGYLPRDGRDISTQQLSDAVLNGWGLDNTTISAAIDNAFQVCRYVEGHDCATLTNLTILAEPHTFEHDHSLSRQDYRMAYAHGGATNNQNFNATIFGTSINVLGDATHMNFQQAQQVRLQRESLAMLDDLTTWFTENRAVNLFEIGFIFAVMGDFNLPGYPQTLEVRKDWWQYWFTNESFPEPLGWHKPTSALNFDFVTSASSAVLAATVTSTPSPLPADATAPEGNPTPLPTTAIVPILPLPTDAPYVAPQQPVIKRQASGAAPAATVVMAEAVASAMSAAGPAPTFMNPYVDSIDATQFAAQQAAVSSYSSAVQAKLASASAS